MVSHHIIQTQVVITLLTSCLMVKVKFTKCLAIICSPVGSLCHTRGVVRTSVIRCVSSVSTKTTRNNEAIIPIFSANVYHVPGLCLLGIGGAPYISHKIMAKNHIFTFLTSSLKQPAGGTSYYARRLL